jgi:flagellar protein FliO/FliZ
MLAPVVLLPFLPLAAVLINDVKVETRAGALTVEIATTEAVATSDIRVATGGPRRLYVYLDGSAARRPSFGEGAEAIVAHARLKYTKLEIPTPERCGEPIGVTRTADGVRVRATCRDASAGNNSGKGSVSAPASLSADRPLPEAPAAALTGTQKAQSQAALRAALALPREPIADEAAAAGQVAATAEPAKAKENSAAKAEPKEQAPAAVIAAPKADSPDAPTAAVVNQDSSGPSAKGAGSEAKSGGGALAPALGVLLLLGVGGVAVVFARRRGTRERLIRIVETASIGPRRSLVVACVGGRTMVLGVSEAGVSLLDTTAMPLALGGTAATRPSDSVEEATLGLRGLAFADSAGAEDRASEPKHEGSLLGRLFHRKPREAEGLAKEDFEQLFAESLEDEELRRKLAMGQSGRTA